MNLYDSEGKVIGVIYDTPTEVIVPNKLVYCLVIGHDINRKGAYGNVGISEFDFNKDLLEEMVVDGIIDNTHTYCILQRDPNISGYENQMRELHDRIDSLNTDISIEFHFNSYADSSVNGNEVLYDASDAGGKKLAELLDECLDILPNRDRGIKALHDGDNGHGFCSMGTSVSIITEPFFGANQDDFVVGGKDRDALKEAYKNFFERMNNG